MILRCPNGHIQNGHSAMGRLCETCIKLSPEDFVCKDQDCQQKSDTPHFHESEKAYFIDENGKKW